jgi:hypothetical protein
MRRAPVAVVLAALAAFPAAAGAHAKLRNVSKKDLTPVFARRARLLVRVAAGTGAVSAVALVLAQGAADADLRPWSAGVLHQALDSMSGRSGCVSGLSVFA